MTTGTREERRREFACWIAERRFGLHITVTLGPNASRAQVEDRLREWVIWSNRKFLSRDWYKARYAQDRMRGIAFFEQSGGWHAHLLVSPPTGVGLLKFFFLAPT